MAKKDCVYYHREFLNPEDYGGSALIEALVNKVRGDDLHSLDAEIKLGDCHRIVTLDFGIYAEGDRERVLEKVATLRHVLVEFEEALRAESRKWRPYKPPKPKREPANKDEQPTEKLTV